MVFAGILVLVLLGNLTAMRWRVPVSACLALLALLILAAALLPPDAFFALAPCRFLLAVALAFYLAVFLLLRRSGSR